MTARIDELIAASSVGVGIRDIEERGIEAHVADLEQEVVPRKKRKASKSPTSRTLDECRKRGLIAGVVEQFVRFPPPGHRVDLFGVLDVIVIVPRVVTVHGQAIAGEIVGLQACAGPSHAARRAKILAEPRARAWVEAGGRLELWSWSKRGGAGKRKLWELRVEAFTAERWRTP